MARVRIRCRITLKSAVAAAGIAMLEFGLERGVREPEVAPQKLIGNVEHVLDVGLRLVED